MYLKRIIFSAFLLLNFFDARAQSVQLSGTVVENETNEPIAFASIFWGSSNKGFYTNFEGRFNVQLDEIPNDTLKVVYSVFKTKIVLISAFKDRKNMQIFMEREIVKTADVEIKLGINPALKWVELAQKNADKNNPQNAENYECEVFSKTILSLNNIGKGMKNSQLGKEIGPLFDTMTFVTGDSSKAILPIFFSEVLSQYYHQKDPTNNKENILASRIKGVGVADGSFISQVMGSALTKYNVYNPTLVVLAKGIPSPIAPTAKLQYNYKLMGVDKLGPRRLFMVKVSPKNPKDLVFNGMIWIEDTTGAVVRLSMELDGNANLNYIDKLRVSQEYIPSPNKIGYICNNSRSFLDIAEVNENASGLMATSIISCKNIVLKNSFGSGFFDNRISTEEDLTKPDSFWESKSHFKLSDNEKRIYSRIDSVKKLPSISKWVDLVTFILDGYVKTKWFDIGPYYYFAGINYVEGFRNRIGFRTSANVSKKFQFEGFLAYGYGDQKLKYGGTFDWYIHRNKGITLTLQHTNDVELIGFSDNDAVVTDNYLVTALNMIGTRNVTYCKTTKFDFGTDIVKGLRAKLSVSHRKYNYPSSDKFSLGWYDSLPTSNHIESELTNATATFKLEYEPKVFHLIRNNKRRAIHEPGPIYTITYQRGIKGLWGSEYEYSRVGIGLSTRKIWPNIGRTLFSINAAKVFGNIPFPLLNIPLGNQAFIYNFRAFNQMRLFEFVSDQNVQFSLEHHFNGFIFNRIPGIRNLKLREIFTVKAVHGTLSAENRALIPTEIPNRKINPIHGFDDKPYVEYGFGVENIFKVLRVDAIWRATHQRAIPLRNLAIKVGLVIGF